MSQTIRETSARACWRALSYCGRRIPDLRDRSGQLAGRKVNFNVLFSGIPIFQNLPKGLADMEIDLTGLSPAEVRKVIRLAVRWQRIDHVGVRGQIEGRINAMIEEAKTALDYFYVTPRDLAAVKEPIYADFIRVLQFLRIFQLNRSLAEKTQGLLANIDSYSFKWKENLVSPDCFPSIGGTIRFHPNSSPLAPQEVKWLFETERIGFRNPDLQRLLAEKIARSMAGAPFIPTTFEIRIMRDGSRPWLINVLFTPPLSTTPNLLGIIDLSKAAPRPAPGAILGEILPPPYPEL